MWPHMKRCTVVAKRPLMFTGAFGFGAWLSGLVFIDRLKTDRARQLMMEATERVIKEKVSTSSIVSIYKFIIIFLRKQLNFSLSFIV